MKGQDIYERITNKMIAQLEQGVVPWIKPWDVSEAQKSTHDIWPRNAVTDYHYNGSNVFMCWMHMADLGLEFGQAQPAFLTYKQAEKAGGHVKKGAKSVPVIYYADVQAKTPAGDDTEDEAKNKWRKRAMISFVFHTSQCSFPDDVMLKGHYAYKPPVGLDDERWKVFINATKANVVHGGTRAFYDPRSDYIGMPSAEAFVSPAAYKATACHELGHWTGHESRLKRDMSSLYGVTNYAFEELIAELSAAFLCARLGLKLTELKHAEYLAVWLKALKGDKRFIVQAASKAGKAADYILNLTKEALSNVKKKPDRNKIPRPKGVHGVRGSSGNRVLRRPSKAKSTSSRHPSKGTGSRKAAEAKGGTADRARSHEPKGVARTSVSTTSRTRTARTARPA